MKNTNKLILGAIVFFLSSGVALLSASSITPEAATGASQEAVKQTTGDMAKEAAEQVTDSTKEKAIGMAKDQANSAVDSGMNKASEAMNPTDKAVDAAKEATK
jgi:hypothetical protein